MMDLEIVAKVFKQVTKIPRGKVTTYKSIADKLGIKSYRLIGAILKLNSLPVIIPCHRVIKSDGSLGGYFGDKIDDKIKLLKDEGIEINKQKNSYRIPDRFVMR